MSLQFNKCFKVANSTQCRYRVLLGSAGSGKSVNVAQDYILKLSQPEYAGCNLLVVRGTEVSHLNSTFAELMGAINRMGLLHIWESKTTPLTLTNKANGNTIIFRGCNDQRAIERLKSVTVPKGKITWVWVEEATELRNKDFNIIDDRLRGELPAGHYYQITLTFNPINSGHWIKRELWDYNSPDIFTHKSTYLDNAFIDEAYKQRAKRSKELDPEGYQVYYCGNWGEVGGLIFTAVDIGDFSKKQFETYSIGTDWGFNHSTAVLLIGWHKQEPYVINEVVTEGKTTAETIELCNTAGIPKQTIMYCDSAEPDRIKQIKQAGFRAYPVSKEPNSVHNQITWLKERIIHVDGRCVRTVKEIQAYKYRKDPVSGLYLDEPVCVDDDCMAALRYGIEPVRKDSRLQSTTKGAYGIW